MPLDKSKSNIGYRLGRMFAVLETVQEESNPGTDVTMREKFYSDASTTPLEVFTNLIKVKNHQLAKISDHSRCQYYEILIGEILDAIDDFPSNLSLQDQGRFSLGYYHQKQILRDQMTAAQPRGGAGQASESKVAAAASPGQ